jgi:hypothetical protein
LFGLLLTEIGAVAALRYAGWLATGSGIRWLACLVAATLPLVIAAALLFGRKFRFSLRALLVIMALVAVFLVVTGIPLRDAIEVRRVTRRLVEAGADVNVDPPNRDFLERQGYSVRASVESKHRAAELAPWLRPLAGDALKFPAHDEVRSLGLNSDSQIDDFASDPATFVNLEEIAVYGKVTGQGLQRIVRLLPKLPKITQAQVFEISVPPEYLSALVDVQYLHLSPPWPWPRPARVGWPNTYPRQLGPEHFTALAALPNLRVLYIHGHDVADADVALLASSKSLEQIFFHRTTVSEAAADELRQQMPACRIYWEGE